MAIDSATVYLDRPNGEQSMELELDVNWQPAEPDVGIMSSYADDFKVTAVNGSTRHAKLVDAIVSRDKKLVDSIFDLIMDGE